MGYDPREGSFQELQDKEAVEKFKKERPWGTIFTVGENIEVKGCVFKVHEVQEARLILKPIKAE